MNVGIYQCIILAALSSGSLSLPSQSKRDEITAALTESLHARLPNHTRQTRSAPLPRSDQFTHYSQLQESSEAPNSLSQLLARLIPRKGFQIRSSLSSRAAAPSHKIKDRDYIGWMDFGRRSAEEYEYSP